MRHPVIRLTTDGPTSCQLKQLVQKLEETFSPLPTSKTKKIVKQYSFSFLEALCLLLETKISLDSCLHHGVLIFQSCKETSLHHVKGFKKLIFKLD